jgi:hypothetical protein
MRAYSENVIKIKAGDVKVAHALAIFGTRQHWITRAANRLHISSRATCPMVGAALARTS